uniref:Rho GTPase-activating protein 20 n=1 Tax=Culex pipiens TaxID=7175 RepID=A0A8D8D0H1_CULPI
MSSWAQRMHRRAATLGSVVTSCGHPGSPYPHRLEKVKFGVPLDEVCKNDIPGPLLVLILKLNKEAPSRKDVFRAPGHQGAMKKLIHFLQQGRLVNVDNYSVYTIASVLKKFLRKIPGGVFGRDGETELFQIVDIGEEEVQQEKMHKLLMSLPGHTQRLLVLLFGTFRVIASNSERAATGMTSEALGVSVAPSFFQSCVSDGKTARMEDVLRFKVATKIMKQMIEQFAAYDLFGRDNYEYYARVTGRVLRVQDEWICSFRYPPPPRGKTAQQNYALKLALETEKTWLQCECERWGLIAQEESHSTPALLTTGGPNVGNSAISLGIIPEHSLLESCARLSVSLEGPGIFQGVGGKSSCSGSSHSSSSTTTRSGSQHHMTLDELRAVNRYAESTKSLSYLPQVHERQAARMRTRSEWFLGARGSLELYNPGMITSTPIPGSLLGGPGGGGGGGAGVGPGGHHGHHGHHGIIGTYCQSVDEHLNDIVVVDVNHLATNHHHHHHLRHHHHHHHHHPLHNKRTTFRQSSAAGWFFEHCDSIEIIAPDRPDADEDDDDDEGVVDDLQDDEDVGDEHDFAVIQAHHFDQREENRRRRRRRMIRQRRHSYDQVMSNASMSIVNCSRPAEPVVKPAVVTSSPTTATTVGTEHNHQNSKADRDVVTAASVANNASAVATRAASNSNNQTTLSRSQSRNASSVGNNTSRQSNLSILVFTVLDFLF